MKFNCSIFTNLSRDHLDYHKTFKDYLNSKLKLFRLFEKNSTIIFDNDLPTSKILKQIGKSKKLKSITIGVKNSDLNIYKIYYRKELILVEFKYKKKLFN